MKKKPSSKTFRFTEIMLRVTLPMLEDPNEALTGYAIQKRTKLGMSTVYASLYSMEEAGLLKTNYEKGDPKKLGRPLRVYYRLTADGKRVANAKLAEVRQAFGAGSANPLDPIGASLIPPIPKWGGV